MPKHTRVNLRGPKPAQKISSYGVIPSPLSSNKSRLAPPYQTDHQKLILKISSFSQSTFVAFPYPPPLSKPHGEGPSVVLISIMITNSDIDSFW